MGNRLGGVRPHSTERSAWSSSHHRWHLIINAVSEHLECSTSKTSRLETGKGIPKARDVRDLLALYGVTDAKVRERLTRWVRDGQQQCWWHDFTGVLDEKRETFVALEADAARMRGYEPALVHGLSRRPITRGKSPKWCRSTHAGRARQIRGTVAAAAGRPVEA